jgi:16S rRNA (guanine527-N7)-methyltransferase
MTYEELVKTIAPEVAVTEQMVASLKTYASLLKEWNEKMNLTAIVEENEVIEKHFFDCLIPAKSLPIAHKKVADLGTGAGFPGLVWAIVFPSSEVTLVEATGKKCTFLNEVIKQCGLKNVKVLNMRAEEIKSRESFDIVTARALAPMNILLEVSAPLVKVGGYFIAMKGSKGEEEFNKTGKEAKTLGLTLKDLKKEDLPNGEGARENFFFLKSEHTSGRYPRRWSEIVAKPLT